MIRCYVTATDSSRTLKDADVPSAEEIVVDSIKRCAGPGSVVALARSPDTADIIFFAESHRNNDAIQHVIRHPLYLRNPHKCVVHCGMDNPEPLVPGLYPSIDRRWAKRLCCEGSPYLAELNPFIGEFGEDELPPILLASFMGSCARKAVRERMATVAKRQDWVDIEVIDSGAHFVNSNRRGDLTSLLALKQKFAAKLKRSKLVLCPAGAGPSSFRIFEAMKSARVPVVIADTWTPPVGPDWKAFLIRIREADIPRLPEVLREMDADWMEKGVIARREWERFCDPATFGPHIIVRAATVLANANSRPRRRQFWAWFYVNGPRRVRALWKRFVRKILRTASDRASD